MKNARIIAGVHTHTHTHTGSLNNNKKIYIIKIDNHISKLICN